MEIIADAGEYVLVKLAYGEVCSFGVASCRVCTRIMRRTPRGLEESEPDEEQRDFRSYEGRLAAESILLVSARLKQRETDFNAFMDMLSNVPDEAPAQVAAPVHVGDSIVLQLEVASR